MTSISSLRHSIKIENFFICKIYFRAGILIFLVLLLPGCMNNMDNSGITGISLPTISINNPGGQVLLLLQKPWNVIFINSASSLSGTGENAEETSKAGYVQNTDEQKTAPVQHFPDSSPALADAQHIDMHDDGEEDGLHITFCRFLRIFIVVLLVAMII